VAAVPPNSGMFLRSRAPFFVANGYQVIRYDDGPYGVITSVADLAEYIKQNSSKDVSMRRRIRMSLRALEGQIVRWPYEHVHVCSPYLPLFTS